MKESTEITEHKKHAVFSIQAAIEFAQARPESNKYKVELLDEVTEQCGHVEVDGGYGEHFFIVALQDYAESIGYTQFAVNGSNGGDYFAKGFSRPMRIASGTDLLAHPNSVIVLIHSKEPCGHDIFVSTLYCEDTKLEEVAALWNQSPSVLSNNDDVFDPTEDYRFDLI